MARSYSPRLPARVLAPTRAHDVGDRPGEAPHERGPRARDVPGRPRLRFAERPAAGDDSADALQGADVALHGAVHHEDVRALARGQEAAIRPAEERGGARRGGAQAGLRVEPGALHRGELVDGPTDE